MQIKLVKGTGSLKSGACWMSALSYYAGESWSDHPDCVCVVIRQLCIQLNDRLPDGERERVIGPHLMAPLGTRGDRTLTQRRAIRAADWAVREIAPLTAKPRGK